MRVCTLIKWVLILPVPAVTVLWSRTNGQLSTLLPLPPWAENLLHQLRAQRRESVDGAPCTHTDLDSLLANCMATMHLASSPILCFLVRSESRHKPRLCVFLGGCSFSPDGRWPIMHFSLSKKKNGAICNGVRPHSSEHFLQCAINERERDHVRRIFNVFKSKVTLLEFDLIDKGVVFHMWHGHQVYTGVSVSISCVFHTSYSTVPFLLIAAEALINPDLYFSADILWLPLLVDPSTYTTSSQLVRYDTLHSLHHGTCVTFTVLPNSKPKGSGLQYHLRFRNLIWCDSRLQMSWRLRCRGFLRSTSCNNESLKEDSNVFRNQDKCIIYKEQNSFCENSCISSDPLWLSMSSVKSEKKTFITLSGNYKLMTEKPVFQALVCSSKNV